MLLVARSTPISSSVIVISSDGHPFSFLSVRPRCFSFHDSALLVSTHNPLPLLSFHAPPRFPGCTQSLMPHFISPSFFLFYLPTTVSLITIPWTSLLQKTCHPNPKIVHTCSIAAPHTYLAPDLSEASTSAASSQSRAGPHLTSSILYTHSFFLSFFWGQLLQTRYKFALRTNRTPEVPGLKSDCH